MNHQIVGKWLLLMLGLAMLPRPLAADCPAYYGYSFLNPAIAGVRSGMAPYYLSFGRMAGQYFPSAAVAQQDENVREWRQRLCNQATFDDVRYLVYEASAGELESLRYSLLGKRSVLSLSPGPAGLNTMARYLQRFQCADVVSYLIFAKRCEPHVTARGGWEQGRRNDDAMRNLIGEAKREFLRTESHFLKLRYAYQAIRLAHYIQDYALALELCNYYLPKIDNDPSVIEYWIMGHRAGALYGLGQRVEAAYLYSRIFENCPGKRESAYRSFRIETDEEWAACLRLCRTDHERATLFALRARHNHSRLLEEMTNIYRLDPQHEALELLLLREVQKLEKDLLGNEYNRAKDTNRRYHGLPRPNAGQRVIDLQGFVRRVLQQQRVQRPALWKLAEGYLEVLAGNYYFAARSLQIAGEMIDNDTLRTQLQAFQRALDILALERVDDGVERLIVSWQQKDPELYTAFPDFPKLTRDKLRVLYRRSGQEGKAYLVDYDLAQIRANPQLDVIDNLLAICRKENPNALEKSLVAKPGGGTIENDLLDLKTMLFIQQGLLGPALTTFQQIPTTEWDNYGQFNPFTDKLRDCVRCPLPDSLQLFNKSELLTEMIKLENQAVTEIEPNLAAIRFYKLGLAYYNLSYFGNAWKAADAFRSGASLRWVLRNPGQVVAPHPQYPLGNREAFDCSRARAYFERARALANEPEIAARATFMAARCEANAFYVGEVPGQAQTFDNFRLLQNNYAQTQFYQRIVAECRYFEAYTRR